MHLTETPRAARAAVPTTLTNIEIDSSIIDGQPSTKARPKIDCAAGFVYV